MERLKKDVCTYIRSMKTILVEQEKIQCSLKGVSRGARHFSFALRLADSLTLDKVLSLAENIAYKSNARHVLAYRSKGFVIFQIEVKEDYWKTYTRQDVIGLGIGLTDGHKQVNFDFADDPQVAVLGMPKSGKSETIKSGIVALANTYTPDECQFLMLDYHHELSDFERLAHLASPIAYQDQAAIDNVLLRAQNEYRKRLAENIKGGPKLVVVLDEALEVLEKNEMRLAIVSTLANARKFNVHVVFGTQYPTAKDFPNILDKLGNKFIGQVRDARTSAQLTGHPKLQANKLTGKGDLLHVVGPDVTRFQVAMATQADINALLRKEIIEPDRTDYEVVTRLPELPAIERSNGRPSNSLEMPLLADYLYVYTDPEAGADAISIAGAKEMFGISRNMHELHKINALQLIDELDKRGLFICREDGDQ